MLATGREGEARNVSRCRTTARSQIYYLISVYPLLRGRFESLISLDHGVNNTWTFVNLCHSVRAALLASIADLRASEDRVFSVIALAES